MALRSPLLVVGMLCWALAFVAALSLAGAIIFFAGSAAMLAGLALFARDRFQG